MSFQIVTEPLDRWPLPDTKTRRPAQFKAGYDSTLKLLRAELEFIGARGAVAVQVVTRNGGADLRKDGMLMSRAQIIHPGVRVSFTCDHGPLTYATDAFETRWSHQMPDWQANLRAIALGLEALRTIDRYGISRRGEQYTGWRALEAAPVMDEGTAVAVLQKWAPREHRSDPLAQLARWARIGAHPDRHAGDHEASNEVLEAIRVLGIS